MGNGEEKFQGTVRYYSKTNGYGFITRSGERDVFVHARQLPEGVLELMIGQRVSYTLEQGHKGPRAKTVELVDVDPRSGK
jgi:CspA family cold shock protein